jgi:hypothetical protein
VATTAAPHPSAGNRRDFKAMERVRLRAARMFEQRRASERDEEAIARWVKQDWPRIRQKRPAARRLDRVPG